MTSSARISKMALLRYAERHVPRTTPMGYDSPTAFVKFCRCPATRALGKHEAANAVGVSKMRKILVSSTDLKNVVCLIL